MEKNAGKSTTPNTINAVGEINIQARRLSCAPIDKKRRPERDLPSFAEIVIVLLPLWN
jgi:hypothetical protein